MKQRYLLTSVILLVSILAACNPAPAEPQIIEKEVTKIVTEKIVETVIVEGTPQVVEKEVTSVVEVEKVVTATPEPEKGPSQGGTLRWIIPSEPDTLDMHNTVMAAAYDVMFYVGSSLLAKDPEGNFVPYLAETWEGSPDGLQWTFTLKKGVKFHDGTDLTASDVVWTFERSISPDVVGGTGSSLGPVESFEAPNDTTFIINLAEPFYPILDSLTDPAFMMIMSPEAVEAAGEDYGRQPVGCGPFIFKEWTPSDKIILERNPDFNWGPSFAHSGPAYLDTIEFRIIPETATQVVSLEAGEGDISRVSASDLELIRGTGMFNIYEAYEQATRPYLQINTTVTPFDKLLVRQAFNYAVDRDVLVKVAALGNAIPQYGPLPLSIAGYWPGVEYIGYPYNLEKAKNLMIEAGYTYNADGMLEKDGEPLALTLLTIAGEESFLKTAEILQEQLRALGVTVALEQMEAGVMIGDMLAGNFEMGMMGFGWSNADLLYLMFHSSMVGALNMGQVQDAELDALLEETRTTIDTDLQLQLVSDAQRYIVEKAYMVPLYTPKLFYAVNNHLEGETYTSLTGTVYIYDAYLTD
ncbi:MAG: ABC transporter substrate-binding protein [Anaerolineales bacterium]|nr:ABC transporter substrate-binding protein [Anaerolineales bacterium]